MQTEETRPGNSQICEVCEGTPGTKFNWSFATDDEFPFAGQQVDALRQSFRRRIDAIRQYKDLRVGWLYRCKTCDGVWHLDGARTWMTYVAAERLPLVLEWNRAPISLSPNIAAKLAAIGPTPPDIYGNGDKQRLTPCRITTSTGEVFDTAMVCVQRDAPIEDYMDFRLGSEIVDISESPFALPLNIREASSRAEEVRMGFSPSLIAMPDEKRFVLNGTTSFFVEAGYRATEAKLFDGSYFDLDPPPSFAETPKITYFVVDGDPGWGSAT